MITGTARHRAGQRLRVLGERRLDRFAGVFLAAMVVGSAGIIAVGHVPGEHDAVAGARAQQPAASLTVHTAPALGPPAAPPAPVGATAAATVPQPALSSTALPALAAPPVVTQAPALPVPAPPPGLVSAIEVSLRSGPLAQATVGVSVRLEGFGEVVAQNADMALVPASNQKLYTAVAALSLLPPGSRFRTEVRTTGPVEGGTLLGDLVLVGGGDPTLNRWGRHSLDDLAAAVHGAGVQRISGRLLVDDSRYDRIRAAPGWKPGDMPAYVGPLSALVVGRNHYRGDPGFAADPSPSNLALFRRALSHRGVVVVGPDAAEQAPSTASVVASLSSEPIEALVARMLTNSDNLIAELLLKEVGLVAKGEGSTAAGIAAADELLLKFGIGGSSADGSGLSRENLRSVREWAVLLETVRRLPVGQVLTDSLAVAGQTGTLWRRLAGPLTNGNVRAKTGAIASVRALSGYLTTAVGRPAVFSIVVNGPHTGPAVTRTIDAIVMTIAADRS